LDRNDLFWRCIASPSAQSLCHTLSC
jgi:hypothetical protein